MRATRDNLGFLLAKALQRWNELLAAGFRRGGFAEVRPAYGSVLLPLFEEDGLRLSELAARSRLSKQAMTTLVRTLEARRLIVRRRAPAGSRRRRSTSSRPSIGVSSSDSRAIGWTRCGTRSKPS